MEMTTDVEVYFLEGCGRCSLGGTPDCKVHSWTEELKLLRSLLLDCGLQEESKWGFPTYMVQSKNVMILSALKDSCTLNFFKGSLLSDEDQLLIKPGPNSQASRYLRFESLKEIHDNQELIKRYVYEAIEVEKAGLEVPYKKNPEPIPDELQQRMDEDPMFKSAFESLTPGRQRGYIIHFSQPKQSKTRFARIDKYTPMILNGEGMHDKYKAQRR